MSTTLEDHVLNQAATKLGFNEEEPNIKNPRNQGVSRFQSGEELVNSVGK